MLYTILVEILVYCTKRMFKHSFVVVKMFSYQNLIFVPALVCCVCLQAQADTIQQAFDKAGGEGIVPPPFDSAVADVDVDLNATLVSR